VTLLLIKVTALFLFGLITLLITRRSTAAMRHSLCFWTLAGSLILPLAAILFSNMLPANMIEFRMAAINVTARSASFTRNAAWLSSKVLLELWALGAALLLARLAIGFWRMRRVTRAATPIAPGVYAAAVNVPIASGLLRPSVLMPRGAEEWPEWQRAAAVRHEKAHIERKDLQANFVSHLACAFYWFHPLAWILSSLLRREQEAACDDAVLHSGFEPATYAEALLAVARNSTSTLLPISVTTGCAMTTQLNVKDRIMRMLDRGIARTTSPKTFRLAAIAFAGLVLAIAIPIRAQEPYKVGGDVMSPRVVSRVDPQYTEEARKQKIAGTVILSVVIQPDGLAHDINVVKSLTPDLDVKAVEAVQQWHFAPGTLKGEPVPVQATIEINFKLQ
jgi:TonB family protein